MQWREAARRLPSIGLKVLVAMTVFVVAYVAYAHVASIASMREYELASYETHLDSEAKLAGFTVVERGGLTHAVRDGVLQVRGTAAGGMATVRIAGRVQRLDDVVRTSVRFRARSGGAYDVFVGIEKADAEPASDDARRVLAVFRNGAPDRFAVEGDRKANGPRHIVDRASPVVSAHAPVDADAGASAAPDAGGPAAVEDASWHELALSHAAYIHHVMGTYDGAPIGSEEVQWWMGTRVRLVFGVVAREPGAEVVVELDRAAYEEAPRPQTLTPFTERFRGRVLDPRRWSVVMPNGLRATTEYDVDPARGLTVRARSLGEPNFQPGVMLLTPPTPLESLSFEARIDVRTLKASAFTIGLVGSGYSPARFYDLGVTSLGDNTIEALSVGHWNGDGQLGVHALPGRWKGLSGTLSFKYDASNGRVQGFVDGTRVVEHKLDLRAGETVQLRLGANLQGPDAVIDMTVREVAFDRPTILPIP